MLRRCRDPVAYSRCVASTAPFLDRYLDPLPIRSRGPAWWLFPAPTPTAPAPASPSPRLISPSLECLQWVEYQMVGGVARMSRRGVPDRYRLMQTEEAASAAITLLNAATRAQNWTERHTFAAVVSDDWVPIAGAPHDLRRTAHDGSEATSPLVLGGIGPVFQIPCTLLDAASSFPGAATGG